MGFWFSHPLMWSLNGLPSYRFSSVYTLQCVYTVSVHPSWVMAGRYQVKWTHQHGYSILTICCTLCTIQYTLHSRLTILFTLHAIVSIQYRGQFGAIRIHFRHSSYTEDDFTLRLGFRWSTQKWGLHLNWDSR